MIEYYKKRAKEYEDIYKKPERQKSILEYQDYIKELFQNRNVLELACGTGFWTETLTETAKTVLATDINKEVLTLAKQKIFKVCKPEFAILDYRNYKPNNEYNGIFIGFLASHLTKHEFLNLVETLIEKTKKPSLIFFMDNLFVEGESTPISKTDKNGNTYQIRKLKDSTEYEIMKNFYTEKEFKILLKDKTYKYFSNKYYWSIEIYT